MTLIIGLTGSIATGKSTISAMFEELNIKVLDSDKIARDVVEPGKDAYNNIIKVFGKSILHEDGTLNRKSLGTIVFNDKNKLKQLNQIVHPAIRSEMNRKKDEYIQAKEQCIVLDIPLLFENKLTHLVDKILLVYVDEDVQLNRLMDRDKSTKEEALSRINAQIPISEKIEKSDEVIDNNGTIEQSYDQLINILKKWNINVDEP